MLHAVRAPRAEPARSLTTTAHPAAMYSKSLSGEVKSLTEPARFGKTAIHARLQPFPDLAMRQVARKLDRCTLRRQHATQACNTLLVTTNNRNLATRQPVRCDNQVIYALPVKKTTGINNFADAHWTRSSSPEVAGSVVALGTMAKSRLESEMPVQCIGQAVRDGDDGSRLFENICFLRKQLWCRYRKYLMRFVDQRQRRKGSPIIALAKFDVASKHGSEAPCRTLTPASTICASAREKTGWNACANVRKVPGRPS